MGAGFAMIRLARSSEDGKPKTGHVFAIRLTVVTCTVRHRRQREPSLNVGSEQTQNSAVGGEGRWVCGSKEHF